VFARVNDKEVHLGTLSMPKGHTSGGGFYGEYDGPAFETCDVVLRSSEAVARGTVDLFEIWEGNWVRRRAGRGTSAGDRDGPRPVILTTCSSEVCDTQARRCAFGRGHRAVSDLLLSGPARAILGPPTSCVRAILPMLLSHRATGLPRGCGLGWPGEPSRRGARPREAEPKYPPASFMLSSSGG
jgi:hypothetical protein